MCQLQMENRNFRSYTVQDLVNKMKKLRQKYKQERDKSSGNGTGKRKKWKFFEIIDRTLCDKLLLTFMTQLLTKALKTFFFFFT